MPARKQKKTKSKNRPLLAKLLSVTRLGTSPRARAEKITALVLKAYELQAGSGATTGQTPRTRKKVPINRISKTNLLKASKSPACILDLPPDYATHRELIRLAKEQGYLTFDDLVDAFPGISNVDMESMVSRLRSMEIDIIELWDVDKYSSEKSPVDHAREVVRRLASSEHHPAERQPADLQSVYAIKQPPIDQDSTPPSFPKKVAAIDTEQLAEFTRKCIKSAEWIAKQFSTEADFEWSCAVLPLCKGLENEIHERMLSPLREATEAVNLSDDCKDKDFSKVARYCSKKTQTPPEMGTFAWFLGSAINSKNRRERSPLLQSFFRLIALMANQGWLLSASGLLSALNEVTQRFRNPAAHIDTLSKEHYQECRTFLIGKAGILWAFVQATRRAEERVGNQCR